MAAAPKRQAWPTYPPRRAEKPRFVQESFRLPIPLFPSEIRRMEELEATCAASGWGYVGWCVNAEGLFAVDVRRPEQPEVRYTGRSWLSAFVAAIKGVRDAPAAR